MADDIPMSPGLEQIDGEIQDIFRFLAYDFPSYFCFFGTLSLVRL